MIPITLDLVHPKRYETGLVTITWSWMSRLHRLLVLTVDCRRRSGGCTFKMETEQRVDVKIVERCPGSIPVVSQFCMATVAGDTKIFPFGNVDVGDILRSIRKYGRENSE